jgi:hypothetical protein
MERRPITMLHGLIHNSIQKLSKSISPTDLEKLAHAYISHYTKALFGRPGKLPRLISFWAQNRCSSRLHLFPADLILLESNHLSKKNYVRLFQLCSSLLDA